MSTEPPQSSVSGPSRGPGDDPLANVATGHRLLEAAGEVFAEQGFRAATVREICKRAGANIAAVNYHYGDKERLYAAVLRYAHQCAQEQYPFDAGNDLSLPARQRLAALIRAMMMRLLDQGRRAWHGKLMIRELAEPTGALDSLVEEALRPQFEVFCRTVGELLGPEKGADAVIVRRCAASVVGQCLFYRHAQPVVVRLFPDQQFALADIENLAGFITEFSLRSIEAMAK